MENGKLWRKHTIYEDPVSFTVEYSKAVIITAFPPSAGQPETYWEKVYNTVKGICGFVPRRGIVSQLSPLEQMDSEGSSPESWAEYRGKVRTCELC